MKILIASDIHNDLENLLIYIEKLNELKFDVVVLPGDFIDVGWLPRGFSKEDIAEVILEEFKSLGKPMLSLPGNHDKDVIRILEKSSIVIHGKGKIISDVGFYGFGGARTPFGTPFEPEEEEIANGLKKGYSEIRNAKIKVQVTHMPPFKTKLDIIQSGAHVGSEAIRKFIEEVQPAVAISAHIHEARGIDELGKTKLINSGRFPEGYCGLVDISDGIAEAKIVNLI